jgi:hypothetical protein
MTQVASAGAHRADDFFGREFARPWHGLPSIHNEEDCQERNGVEEEDGPWTRSCHDKSANRWTNCPRNIDRDAAERQGRRQVLSRD